MEAFLLDQPMAESLSRELSLDNEQAERLVRYVALRALGAHHDAATSLMFSPDFLSQHKAIMKSKDGSLEELVEIDMLIINNLPDQPVLTFTNSAYMDESITDDELHSELMWTYVNARRNRIPREIARERIIMFATLSGDPTAFTQARELDITDPKLYEEDTEMTYEDRLKEIARETGVVFD